MGTGTTHLSVPCLLPSSDSPEETGGYGAMTEHLFVTYAKMKGKHQDICTWRQDASRVNI